MTKGSSDSAGKRISTKVFGKYGTYRSNSPEQKNPMKRFNGVANRPTVRKPSLPKVDWGDKS